MCSFSVPFSSLPSSGQDSLDQFDERPRPSSISITSCIDFRRIYHSHVRPSAIAAAAAANVRPSSRFFLLIGHVPVGNLCLGRREADRDCFEGSFVKDKEKLKVLMMYNTRGPSLNNSVVFCQKVHHFIRRQFYSRSKKRFR